MRVLLFLMGLIPTIVSAAADQDTSGPETVGQSNAGIKNMWDQICQPRGVLPCSLSGNLIQFLSDRIIKFVFPLIGGIAVIMVIYAGLRIIFSQGKDEAVTEAKKIILYAVLGVFFSMIGYAAISFANWLFGYLFS